MPSPLPDINDVRIGRRDGDRADRSRRLVVEDRHPRAAAVGRLPHAAVHGADVEHVGLRRDAVNGLGAAAAKRPDVAPAEFAKQDGANVVGSGLAGDCACRQRRRRCDREDDTDQRRSALRAVYYGWLRSWRGRSWRRTLNAGTAADVDGDAGRDREQAAAAATTACARSRSWSTPMLIQSSVERDDLVAAPHAAAFAAVADVPRPRNR